ncbi:MAG: DUF4240 domain-containing protein [Synergistaceae bacterium]|nr:DUF4240 domain-containing protein [Synergistaceae bacterium]
MKKAKDFMSEVRFWTIIEASNNGRNLEAELCKLSEEEIMGYRYWWIHFHKLSYNQSLWAVAYTVLGGCSDDGFDYFRYWLITRGRDVFYEALRNADSLCGVFELLADDEYPEWEDVAYIPKDVFEQKFGKDFYSEEDTYDFEFDSEHLPEIKFEWNEDDEETIRAVCPKTFDRWWDNDRF